LKERMEEQDAYKYELPFGLFSAKEICGHKTELGASTTAKTDAVVDIVVEAIRRLGRGDNPAAIELFCTAITSSDIASSLTKLGYKYKEVGTDPDNPSFDVEITTKTEPQRSIAAVLYEVCATSLRQTSYSSPYSPLHPVNRITLRVMHFLRKYLKAEGLLALSAVLQFLKWLFFKVFICLRELGRLLVTFDGKGLKLAATRIYDDTLTGIKSFTDWVKDVSGSTEPEVITHLKRILKIIKVQLTKVFQNVVKPRLYSYSLCCLSAYAVINHGWPYLFERISMTLYLRAQGAQEGEKLLLDALEARDAITRYRRDAMETEKQSQRRVVVVPAHIQALLVQQEIKREKLVGKGRSQKRRENQETKEKEKLGENSNPKRELLEPKMGATSIHVRRNFKK